MLLRWPQNHIEEEHLSHWISSSMQDEAFLKQTIELLDEWNTLWISEEECKHLKILLDRGEVDLVYRYLDLQLSYRNAKDKEILHDSLELEKHLDLYIKNPQKSHLLLEVGTRCIQHTLYTWFLSLNLESPAEFKNLKEADLAKKIQRILQNILKEQSLNLNIRDRFFIEEFLKGMQQSDDDLEYLNRFCSSLEQINLWESTLNDICDEIKQMEERLTRLEDEQTLRLQLNYFEKEVLNLHQLLGKSLATSLLPAFSETQQAIVIGKFRLLFQNINNAYGKLRGRLLSTSSDVHLCCMCHFSDTISDSWPINNRIIKIYDEGAKRSHAKSQSTSSLLIFTCAGGKGHLSTTKAMGQYAEGKYHILVASTLEDTLASTDFFKKLLFDFSQEKFYNHLLKNEEFEWLKLVTSVGPFFIMMQQESIERLIRLEIFKQNPEMIISCFPIMNSMFLNVAKEMNLPLLMVTTDLDTGLFVKGMHSKSCDLNYPNYRMTLSYEDPEMRAIIERVIPKDKIHVSGFPVRPSFSATPSNEDLNQIRKRFSIEENEQVILVMMGGNAGLATEKYAEILAEFQNGDVCMINQGKQPLHVICLCGDQNILENQQMLQRINQFTPKSSLVKIRGIPATEAIADLMSISEVLITKPGGCSTNEALAKKLPMIFHAPFALMDWEVFNMEFCIKVTMGARFKMASQISLFQDHHLKNKQKLLPLLKQAFQRRQELRKAIHAFESKNFREEFLYLVENLLLFKTV